MKNENDFLRNSKYKYFLLIGRLARSKNTTAEAECICGVWRWEEKNNGGKIVFMIKSVSWTAGLAVRLLNLVTLTLNGHHLDLMNLRRG